MAKKTTPFNNDVYEREHFTRIEQYVAQVNELYKAIIEEIAKKGASLPNVDQKKLFKFDDYPQIKDKVNKMFAKFHDDVTFTISMGNKTEWLKAAEKNDNLINSIFNKSALPKETLRQYSSRNLEALKDFQKRKSGNDRLGLSDRVWNYTKQFKQEIELGLDIGIGEGKSAAAISREIRQYLNNPDVLFRRVRDKHNNLNLSQAAKAFNPGQGVYRSSYKNALRLTRTETNMAYRTSDHERWKQLDFVVGIEIRLSNNPNHCPTCESLAGRYPKQFKFSGWHPQCRCVSVSILKTEEEINEDEKKMLAGNKPSNKSKNSVNDVPDGFKEWVETNRSRSAAAKSQPFFIRDNFKGGKIEGGLKFKVKSSGTTTKTPEAKPSKLDESIKMLESQKIEYNDVKPLQRKLTEKEIIDRVGGGDLTKGSCSSLAFAYAGNKGGLDVLDFRDGHSRFIFSKVGTINDITESVGGTVVKHTNDFTKAAKLLSETQIGKEYYFTCGQHAAIVRKTTTGYEYLELQSATDNRFKPLNNDTLKWRFGAKKTHSLYGRKYETSDTIIDIDLLNKDAGFRKVLGYINTNTKEQKKGASGSTK